MLLLLVRGVRPTQRDSRSDRAVRELYTFGVPMEGHSMAGSSRPLELRAQASHVRHQPRQQPLEKAHHVRDFA
jgi:hypothetical protein